MTYAAAYVIVLNDINSMTYKERERIMLYQHEVKYGNTIYFFFFLCLSIWIWIPIKNRLDTLNTIRYLFIAMLIIQIMSMYSFFSVNKPVFTAYIVLVIYITKNYYSENLSLHQQCSEKKSFFVFNFQFISRYQ